MTYGDYQIFGAFKNKTKAKQRSKKVHGFVKPKKVHGKTRYVVLRKTR